MRLPQGSREREPARIGARTALAAGVLLGLANCSTEVANTSSPQLSSISLPRPQSVVVLDFAADQAKLQLDQGVRPRLQRTAHGASALADEQAMLFVVRNSISDALVANIRRMGLPAERAAEAPLLDADTVVVRGQILDVNQGNRTRRVGVGFGAGKSDVTANVAVYYERPGTPAQLLQTYDASSNSGRKPGTALGGALAVGRASAVPVVLTGTTGVASERNKSPVAKEGAQLGDHVAYELGEFFVRQGWVQPSAVPRPSPR
jgi:hypothetical protein